MAVEPQMGDRDLAPNPHRVELVGAPGSLVWPDLCPGCGAAAQERIPVGKVFMRRYGVSSDLPNPIVVGRASIPFCPACIGRHRSEAEPMTSGRRLLTLLLNQMAIPMVLAGGVALFCLKEAVASLPDMTGAAIMGGIGLFFALISVLSGWQSWRGSVSLRVEPQTSVTLACDFSDDISEPFDAPRYAYAIRDPAFAAAFTEANREAVWNPGLPSAKRGRSRRRVATVLLIVAAAVGLLLEFFGK